MAWTSLFLAYEVT